MNTKSNQLLMLLHQKPTVSLVKKLRAKPFIYNLSL